MKYDVPWEEIYYPEDAVPLRVSPYYKKIYINKKGEEIDSRDSSFQERREKIILNYPTEVINYFVKENLDVSNIFNRKFLEKSLKFIYPSNNLKIIIPKDFDGEKSIIVKIANLKNQELYWYINKEYIGKDFLGEKNLILKKENMK